MIKLMCVEAQESNLKGIVHNVRIKRSDLE
jgi:hypothetical protein